MLQGLQTQGIACRLESGGPAKRVQEAGPRENTLKYIGGGVRWGPQKEESLEAFELTWSHNLWPDSCTLPRTLSSSLCSCLCVAICVECSVWKVVNPLGNALDKCLLAAPLTCCDRWRVQSPSF